MIGGRRKMREKEGKRQRNRTESSENRVKQTSSNRYSDISTGVRKHALSTIRSSLADTIKHL
jgi:hypothetical protein